VFFATLEGIFTISLLYITLYSFGVNSPWSILVLVLLLSEIITGIIPVPQGFGTAEISMIFLLIALLGISAAEATVATAIFRIFYSYLPILLGGIAVMLLSRQAIKETF
jgi:uncharacterized protein (TIRG00374 family)